MPLAGNSKIGVNGIILGTPGTVGTILRVISIGPPPVIADSLLRQFTDAAVEVITVGAVNVDAGIGATETFRLSGGLISEGAGDGSFIGGRGAVSAGVDGVAVGRAASAGALEAIAIGRGASAVGAPAIAIGAGASAPANNDIVIGGSVTNAAAAVVIGFSASGQSNGGAAQVVAIGTSAIAGSTLVGGSLAVAIGHSAVARRYDIAIGASASSSANSADNVNIVIGHSATANVSGSTSIVIGHSGVVSGTGNNTVLIGHNTSSTGAENILIGRGVAFTGSNSAVIGGPNINIQTVIIGQGTSIASPSARVLRFTDASGTDNAAGNFTIQAPRSTGAAASAAFIVQVGVVGASSGTLQTLRDALSATFTNTAGQTALSVYDVNTAAMARVLVGAAGTGPAGVGRALYLA